MKKMSIYIAVAFLVSFLWSGILSSANAAQGGYLHMESVTTPTTIGGKGKINVYIESKDQFVNAVSGTLLLPADVATLQSVSTNGSIIEFWVQDPKDAQGSIIVFEGVLFAPGFRDTKGFIFSFEYTLKKQTNGLFQFSEGALLANDGKGSNILAQMDTLVLKQSTSSTTTPPAGDLITRVLGRILLQVEAHGEAWYIYPITKTRYYLADGPSAYQALRRFGLGITNKDISRIPVGIEKRFVETDSDVDGLSDKLEEGLGTSATSADTDNDGVNDGVEVLTKNTNPLGSGSLAYDSAFAQRLSGRILLQVESRGEAWYINPADGKRYYMRDGDAAYAIMRYLSLGITNTDLAKIGVYTNTDTSSSEATSSQLDTNNQYVFTKFLSEGSIDAEVRLLQEFLQKLGFFPKDIDPTAIYGKTTVDAVADFQRAYGLPVAGYVGPATRTLLNSLYTE